MKKKQHIDMNGVLRIGRLTGFKTLSPKHFERTLYLLLARASSVTVHSYPIEYIFVVQAYVYSIRATALRTQLRS